jgi:hypothetical protein
MAAVSPDRETAIKARMEFLAGIIQKLSSDEIWALLDALFLTMGEEEKEDLHDAILASQDTKAAPEDCLPADQFFVQLERARDLSK